MPAMLPTIPKKIDSVFTVTFDEQVNTAVADDMAGEQSDATSVPGDSNADSSKSKFTEIKESVRCVLKEKAALKVAEKARAALRCASSLGCLSVARLLLPLLQLPCHLQL